MSLKDDMTIVIRSVGERTEKLCLYKLSQEVPESNIHLIRNMPLYESTGAVCEYAVNAGRKYTVMIGADYIPRVGFLQDLYDMAETMSGKWLFVKGTIIDKFLLEFRGDQGGPMLYPTKVLQGWLNILPKITNKRTTEATCQQHYRSLGYATLRGKTWLALHDYEQHYQDIYRSMFVGGKKHRGHAPRILPRWKELAKSDRDYEVALYAHLRGAKFKGQVNADYREDYGWSGSPFVNWEKPLLEPHDYNTEQYRHLSYEFLHRR